MFYVYSWNANLKVGGKAYFAVICLKVDRLFEWKRGPNSGIFDTIKKQKKNTKQEFDERVQIVVKEFAEQVCLSSLIMRASLIKGRTLLASASGKLHITSGRSSLRR